MSNPATEMEICGTVIALMAGWNETKMLNAISKIVFNPSRNTGGLDDSAHPIKNYGILTPFTVYENGVIMQMPNVDASIKPVPSPLTDWGKITITYTDVKVKDAVEQLFTKYPNSIQRPPQLNATAEGVTAAAATSQSQQQPRTNARRIRTKGVRAASNPAPVSPIGLSVVVTGDGLSVVYKSEGKLCKVIEGKGEVGKSGDHLKVCSTSENGLLEGIRIHEQTKPKPEYINNGIQPLANLSGGVKTW